MPWINTAELLQSKPLSRHDQHQVYCGLDSCVTLEVREQLGTLFNEPPIIYDFERALQAPYLEIMQRGFKVDERARQLATEETTNRIFALQAQLAEFSLSVWDKGLNPRSHKQLLEFFYGAMQLPEHWKSVKGTRKLSMDRDILEKLEEYLYARPIIATILAIRELAKQLELFETEIDSDRRFRTSYNIAGTETGRPSSSSNAFGTGGNAQNIAPSLRYIFIADPGYKLCVIDLEQVEARDVGFFCGCLFGDWSYLDACESGDLHTNNAKRIWPELQWTGDRRADRTIAEGNFYRDFSYRDMAKRGSHLSNYSGTAWTAARALKVPQEILEEFQARYILGRKEYYDKKTGKIREAIEPAFPCIPQWWNWTATQLQTTHSLTTPFGRQRTFFGRPGDDTTLREAIAFLPQSTTADRMNLGLWRVWRKMPNVQLLAQTYDSITFQYSEEADENSVISEALELIRVELKSNCGRSYIVPGEAKIGWNWGARVTQDQIDEAKKQNKKPPKLNPLGLRKWNPNNPDTRTRPTGLKGVTR